jgi:hypothetical protein
MVSRTGQGTGGGLGQKLGEADDVGQRRAQLIGHVLNEIVLQLVGAAERLVLVQQRPLDVDAVRDVDEGDHNLAVGQMDQGVAQDAAILELRLAMAVAALIVEAGDGGNKARPWTFLGQQVAHGPDLGDVGVGADKIGLQRPQPGK